MNPITFFVPGTPRPGGSKTPRRNSKTGALYVHDACAANKDWRASVVFAAHEAYDGPPLLAAMHLGVVFYMPRAKGHFGTGRNAGKLKASAPSYHTKAPDATKLLRALEDAITDSGIWRDDSQVVYVSAVKTYVRDGERPGARVTIKFVAQERKGSET